MKVLIKVDYSDAGMKGLLKEGGSSRRTVMEKLSSNMGGSVESFYFTAGEPNAYIVAEFPDHIDLTAVGMTVAAGGGARTQTSVLLTPEELDQATERAVEYRPPGA